VHLVDIARGCTINVLSPADATNQPSIEQQPVKQPALTSIRKVYLTGTKERAIKSALHDLAWHTCLEAVTNPSEADAIMVLEQSRFIMGPPDRTPSGVLNCRSSVSGASCTDTGSGETVAIDCTRDGSSCQTSSYNAYALLDAAGDLTRALVNRSLNRATLLDKSHSAVLWLFDEGNREGATKGAGFYAPLWWGQLNTAVGCGKATMNPHKKWKKGQWPEPAAQ
jgi:hypothetical protein